MLVLSRKQGERIQIGEDIILTVVELRVRRVKLGIDAPRECPILRMDLEPEICRPIGPPHSLITVEDH